MSRPVLVIMAAGMGSRYGGLKQIDPVDEKGHIIIDFSIYDAVRAGFKKIVFVISKKNEAVFRGTVGRRAEREAEVSYVFQDKDLLPGEFKAPEERVKPWGTGHAVLCAKDVIDGPFAVINADDYYGPAAFKQVYDHLAVHGDDAVYGFVMSAYRLGNTLTDNGSVSRGICEVNDDGYLIGIREHTYIVRTPEGAAFSEDGGVTLIPVPEDVPVSMNMWGFPKEFLDELEKGFERFLNFEMPQDPAGSEYFLPSAVDSLIKQKRAFVRVLYSEDRWYGVTYRQDREIVCKALGGMEDGGFYKFQA